MKRGIAIAIITISLLTSGAFSILPVQANFKPAPLPHIYIQSDGSVNPSSAPISRNGNVYTLTGNLTDAVLNIRRSNIVVDGAGFTIPGISGIITPGYGFDYSIILTGVNNVTVKNFKIANRNIGIYINASFYCTVTGNMIREGGYGVWLTNHSSENVIFGNSVNDCFYGIYFDHSRNNVLRNNALLTCSQSLAVTGDTLEDFINDVDASNSANGKPVHYWVNKHGSEVPPNAGCIILVNCTGITVQNQTLAQNKYGVLLAWTTTSTVRGNIIEGNQVGIYLYHSSCNTIAGNGISSSLSMEENEGHGIRVQSSYNNIISGNNVNSNQGAGICVSQSPGTRLLDNNITGNTRTGITIINNSHQFVVFRNFLSGNMGVTLRVADCINGAIVANNITKNRYYALYLTGSLQGNSIYGNSFDDNGFDTDKDGIHDIPQVYVSSTIASPAWDNGTIGNYWSDYLTLYPNASEIDESGIGDLPYVIDYYNIDHFPLMAPLRASNVSMPEVAVPPLPPPTPQSSPTATPVSPSLSMSPPQTEQSTASEPQEEGNESNLELPSATYVALAVVSVVVIAVAVAPIVLKRVTRILKTTKPPS